MENKHWQSSSKFNISLRVPLEISIVYSWGMCYIVVVLLLGNSLYLTAFFNQVWGTRSKGKSSKIIVPCLFTDLRARHQMYSGNDGPLFPIDKCTRKTSKLDYNFYNLQLFWEMLHVSFFKYIFGFKIHIFHCIANKFEITARFQILT